MTPEKIYLFDTTLRDGQQTPGINFTLDDKIAVAKILDDLGIDYVEGGYPGANPLDTKFFSTNRTKHAMFVAFGMTKRPGVSLSNDYGFGQVLQAQSDAVCLVAKSSDYHVGTALGCTADENLTAIDESVKAALAVGKIVMLDCEHFFDGFKSNPSYAVACAKTAYDAGARWVVLCDTNGGTQPKEIYNIVSAVIAEGIPGAFLGIHAHNDTGQAVANAIAAVEAGVRQIQGTLNGIGERCGNTNLVTLMPTLCLKPIYRDRFTTAVDIEKLTQLSRISRSFDKLLSRVPDHQAPYVGISAFTTKAGIHASGILKDSKTYEHVSPESVGNSRKLLVSAQGGKANFIQALKTRGILVEKDDPRLDNLITTVKEREALGFSYEDAEESFELLARAILGYMPHVFTVEHFSFTVNSYYEINGGLTSKAKALVKINVSGNTAETVAKGDEPLTALCLALRRSLSKFCIDISDIRLVKLDLRCDSQCTGKPKRIVIESTDKSGVLWHTVGVSNDLIEATFHALIDAVNYKVMKKPVAQISRALDEEGLVRGCTRTSAIPASRTVDQNRPPASV